VRLAITADLHWGSHAAGDAASREIVAELHRRTIDLLVLAGDVGAGQEFEPALELFDSLTCQKALVAGNHDLWVRPDDPRGDSLTVYQKHLPDVCARHGFHYLDGGALHLPNCDLSLVGSINWYDYSWTNHDELARHFPDWEDRLKTKRFTRGRHNDARFIRWPTDDRGFTAQVVAAFERSLCEAVKLSRNVIVVTHHPPFFGLAFPRDRPPNADQLLWDAFAGNTAMEAVLKQYADQIPFVFCGHTHRARHNTLGTIRGHNVGSDYGFKRLLILDWPEGQIGEQTFDLR